MTPSFALVSTLTGVAFLAGLVDAVAGGGGLLTLPALLAAGLPPHTALATNKGQSVFGAAAATLAFWRRKALDPELSPFTFPMGFFGALVGTQLVLRLSPALLRPVVLVLLPLAACAMLVRRKEVQGAELPRRRRITLALVLAATIGCYDGFFGPGTGTFLVVGFSMLLHMTPLRATANAKVVNLASNLAAFSLFATRGTVLYQIAVPMGLAQLTGGFVGAHLALRGGDRLVRGMVVVVVAALVLKLALDLRAG